MKSDEVIDGLEIIKATIKGDMIPDSFLDILDEAIKKIKWGEKKAKEARRWKKRWLLDLRHSSTSKGEKE